MRDHAVKILLAIAAAIFALSQAQPPASAPKPTALIRGRILLPNGRPAARALVRVIGPSGGFPRTATAGADGRYEVTELMAGDYLVSAGKPGYLALQYGQMRAFERGKVVTVRDGETIEKIDITLQASGAISGRVVDEYGDPVEGAQVRLMELMFVGGRHQLLATAGVGRRITNDQGRYRLYGVPPGRYAIVASTADSNLSTFFPNVARPAEARLLTVALSQEVDDVDIMMVGGSGATIRGTVADSRGKPIRTTIFAGTSQRSGGVGTEPRRETSNADGSFEIKNLPPGEYVLQVILGGDVNGGRAGEFAARFVTVADADIDNVNIRTSAGSRLEGRIVFEGGGGAGQDVILTTIPSDFDRAPLGGPGPRSSLRADGTFVFEGLNGPHRIRVMRAPPGWILKSIRVNGRDVIDEPLEFGTAEDSLTDVEVTLTNRVASIAGTVANAQGHLLNDYTAIVFATAPDRWYQQTRFLNFTRPKADGAFSIADLPAGEYYVAAVDWMQGAVAGGRSETQDPAFLESLIPRATRVTLTEGQAATLSLRVIVR